MDKKENVIIEGVSYSVKDAAVIEKRRKKAEAKAAAAKIVIPKK